MPERNNVNTFNGLNGLNGNNGHNSQPSHGFRETVCIDCNKNQDHNNHNSKHQENPHSTYVYSIT